MSGLDRKAAIAAYKERKPSIGVYAVRCAATGEVWVGSTPNLRTRQNSLWFSLRQGNYPNRSVQAAFSLHGETAFTYEITETLDNESDPNLRQSVLKARAQHWRMRLSAQPL